ncbi:hypothetical protein [Herpetosiphon geysericola]|uniref:Uncharacterized protein n=1 Tax=Herpetosiphon geysericola TaxID=70996 RepID=A0A0P6Y1Q0_9CHLR|nr:hypothetical protein [Herpetosiphon geysericola]KPL83008.1 hypothetical protein SE18_19380 [Herpetosiphon geysericola]
MEIMTPQQRTIWIESITIANWMSQALEGSPEGLSRLIRRQLQHPKHAALLICDPGGDVLPPYKCTAILKSTSLTAAGFYSWVEVCWFVANLDLPIPIMVATLVERLVWEDVAQDRSFDDL